VTEHEINLDLDRAERIGLEEAIFCAHKSSDQIEVVLDKIHSQNTSCLLTRLDAAHYMKISASYRKLLDYDEVSGTAFFNWQVGALADPEIAILTAGSSDVPVAREAMRTLSYFRVNALPIFDVGVAGLWRLLERIGDIRPFPVVIAVLGGLFPGLIVAVPTSVGYGVAAGGGTALNAILASCASGIVTVNIDNGYGAACAALRVLRPQRRAATAALDPQSVEIDPPARDA